MRLIIKTSPSRPKPKAGDEKTVKGVTMIRRLKKYDGCYVVSNGRPIYEWVEKVGNQ